MRRGGRLLSRGELVLQRAAALGSAPRCRRSAVASNSRSASASLARRASRSAPLVLGAAVGKLLQMLHQLQFAAGGKARRSDIGTASFRGRCACRRRSGSCGVIASSEQFRHGAERFQVRFAKTAADVVVPMLRWLPARPFAARRRRRGCGRRWWKGRRIAWRDDVGVETRPRIGQLDCSMTGVGDACSTGGVMVRGGAAVRVSTAGVRSHVGRLFDPVLLQAADDLRQHAAGSRDLLVQQAPELADRGRRTRTFRGESCAASARTFSAFSRQ